VLSPEVKGFSPFISWYSTEQHLRNVCKILVGKPEGKRPLGRHRHRCEDNIKMDIKDIGWEFVDWIHMS
jgi:hypothetical protein